MKDSGRSGRHERSFAFAKAGSSAAISQVAALLLLPVLFRIYTPEDFGLWAMLQAGVLAAAAVSTLRFDLAVVTEQDAGRAAKLFWGCMALGGAVALLVAAIAAGVLHRLDPSTWDAATLGLASVWLVAAVFSQSFQAWLLREGRFGIASISIILTLAGANALQVLAALWSPDHRGLIAGSAMGALLGGGVAAFSCGAKRPPAWSGWSGLGRVLVHHRRFVVYSLPFTVLSLVRERVPILVLAAFAPPALVGIYSQAWRLVHIPSGLAGGALRPVIFHAAARSGVESVSGLVQQIVGLGALLAASWVGVAVAEPALLFGLVLGDAWRDAGVFAAVLAVPALLFMLTNWFDRLLDVVHRQDANLKLEVLSSLLSVGGFALALAVGAPVLAAVTTQGLALTIAYLTVLLVAYRICGFPLRPLLARLGVALGLGGAAWGVTSGASAVIGPSGGLLTGGAFALAVTGLVALRSFRAIRAAIAGAR